MKALGQILLYFAATVLIGALLAPPLYWSSHALAAHLNSASLNAFLVKTDFPRFFDRAIMIVALVLLWPFLHALRIQNFGDDLGLARDRRGWRRLATGFLIAFLTLVILGAVLIFTGICRLRVHVPYGKLAWLPVTAIVVAIIEEVLFRGALQGAVRKTTVDGFATVTVAVIYAAVHFLKPGIEPPAVHWWSGFELLPDTFRQFGQPALLMGGFTTLLLVGLVLGDARNRTRSLWMPIGLHAGWICGKMGLPILTRHSESWPWLGPDILIGLGPVVSVLAAWVIVWLLLREPR